VLTDRSESLLKRVHTLDPHEFIVDLVEESGTCNGGLVAGGRVDRLNPYLTHFLPPAVPTGPRNLEVLVGLGREDCVPKRRRKRLLRADLER